MIPPQGCGKGSGRQLKKAETTCPKKGILSQQRRGLAYICVLTAVVWGIIRNFAADYVHDMKKFSIIFTLIALSFVSLHVSAQIRGVVTDSVTNEPLMYVTVQYEGKGVGSVTNVDGEY